MRRLLLTLVFATVSTAALAQIQIEGPVETVTSQAQRDDNTARRAVQAILAPSPSLDGQYAKWKEPICPHVYGLGKMAAYLVESRIKEIATKVGAPVDHKDPCVANIGIIVSVDPQKTYESIAARAPYLVMTANHATKVEYPVQTWYAGLLRDYNGKASLDQTWEDAGLEAPPQVPAQLSRLSTGQTAEMGAATVLVNTAAVTGMSLSTLADYVALQTLSQTPTTGKCQEIPSISNLLLTNCAAANHVEQLSDIDMALLTGLYAAPEKPELLQRQRIITAMKQALEQQRTR